MGRSLILVVNPDGIDRVISKYVDFGHLYLKDDGKASHVEFIDRCDNNTLMLCFNKEIKSNQVSIYTLSERYIEFEMEVVEKADSSYPENTYLLWVNSCRIAQQKRKEKRIDTSDWELYVKHITLMDVSENPIEIMNSVRFQVIIHECDRKLGDYDYGKAYFCNDKNLPIEIRYVIEKGEPLQIKDLHEPIDIFDDKDNFFSERLTLLDGLKRRFNKLKEQYRSFLIRPINYSAISGRQFTFGYIIVAAKERKLEDIDIQKIDSIAEDTYKNILGANYVTYDVKEKVLDISLIGAMIEVTSDDLAKKLRTQNWCIFSLVFKLQQPIRISGRVVYSKRRKHKNIIGIEFKGSGFGGLSRKLLEEHIERCSREYAK